MHEYELIESRIAALDQTIEQLKATATRIKKERLPLKTEAAQAAIRLKYLNFTKWLRAPADAYVLWKAGVVLILPMVIGVLCLVLTDLIADSFSVAIWGCGIGAMCIAGLAAILLYHPSDAQLPTRIARAESCFQEACERLAIRKAMDGLAAVEEQLGRAFDECREQKQKLREEIASGKLRRAELLKRDWKAMRGYQWEEYLVEVCSALGANAKRIGKAGDQGVDLIIDLGATQIAVQAKGYDHSVNNKAVQEAVAGMLHYGCTASGVMTNSRFTRGAQELAATTGCILIGEEEFPDFVMGKLQLRILVDAIATRQIHA